MARSNFVHKLVRKYREIASTLGEPETDVDALTVSLDHLQAVILLFEPGYDVGQLAKLHRYRRRPGIARGDYIRTALQILRQSPEPLTALDIARRTLQANGNPNPTRGEALWLRRGMMGKLRYWANTTGHNPARFSLPK
jgi:hypothetical protein